MLVSLAVDRSLAAARAASRLTSLRRLMAIAAIATLARLVIYIAYAQLYGSFDAICQWDCHWYVDTIDAGYDAAPRGVGHAIAKANWAFFPSYILASRAVTAILGVSVLHGAVIVSVLATFGFLLVSARYLELTRGAIDPWLWAIFVLAFPNSFYLSSGYTESLYLLVATASLYAFMRERTYQTAGLVALTTATRAVGVTFLPLVILERLGFALRAWRRRSGSSALINDLADSLLPIVIAPLGLVAFMAYLYHLTGDALAFSHVQASWGRGMGDPFHQLFRGLAKLDLSKLPEQSRTLNALGAIVGLGAAGYLLARRRPIEAWLCASSVLIPLSTELDSLPRYVAGTPVFLFAMFDLLGECRSIWLRWLIIAACAALQLFLLRYWFLDAPFLT